jgi:hypothetical protein
MSQDFTQNVAAPGGGGGGTTTGVSGGTCAVSGLYKASDGRIEFIQPFVVGDKFHNFPGGTAKAKCTWTLMSRSSDGNRGNFTAVKVAAGSA